mmetsp:Transcript_68283/g.211264  ORF Transcript_68283/g.211264 Transcript_68283/m.211264 type:complete len:298 (+) Transcript_68283:858-1751(+)
MDHHNPGRRLHYVRVLPREEHGRHRELGHVPGHALGLQGGGRGDGGDLPGGHGGHQGHGASAHRHRLHEPADHAHRQDGEEPRAGRLRRGAPRGSARPSARHRAHARPRPDRQGQDNLSCGHPQHRACQCQRACGSQADVGQGVSQVPAGQLLCLPRLRELGQERASATPGRQPPPLGRGGLRAGALAHAVYGQRKPCPERVAPREHRLRPRAQGSRRLRPRAQDLQPRGVRARDVAAAGGGGAGHREAERQPLVPEVLEHRLCQVEPGSRTGVECGVLGPAHAADSLLRRGGNEDA